MSWIRSLLVGLAMGAAVALWICSIALDHNPQGEFADSETGAFTRDLYILFAAWTAFIGLPVGVALGIARYFMRRSD